MYKNFAVFLIIFAVLQTRAQEQTGVEVAVYYESLCPDSIRFITKQLYPVYNVLGNNFNVTFVPYGKANQTFGSNGWEFECQHGPSECFGNKYQACALAQNYSQETNVKFVNCVMGSRSPAAFQTIYLCAAQLDLSFEDINTCFNTNGDVLLAALGNKTHAVEPTITFVPTVIFNGKFDDDLQNLAQTNFKEALCSVIPVPKPAACTTKKNKLKFFFSHIPIFRSF